jgi:hypothetical protein
VGFWRWLLNGVKSVIRGTPSFLRDMLNDRDFLFPLTIVCIIFTGISFTLWVATGVLWFLLLAPVFGLLACYGIYRVEGSP